MNATLTTREPIARPTRARPVSPATWDVWLLPLVGIAATALVYRLLPPWGAMCLWAMTLFYAFKWITYFSLPREATKSLQRKRPVEPVVQWGFQRSGSRFRRASVSGLAFSRGSCVKMSRR